MDDVTLAMLGDHEAAGRLTASGIIIPCPHCGSKDVILSNWGMWRCWCTDCHAKGEDCLISIDAVRNWNTRAAVLTPQQLEKLKEE